MKKLPLLAISVALVVSGCREDTAKLLSEQYNAAMSVYHGADSKAAEEALISLRALLHEKRLKAPLAVDYDELEGIVVLRLYSIYEIAGRVPEATRAMELAAQLLHRRFKPVSNAKQREEQLKMLLQGLESELSPQWKTSAGRLN